MSLTLLLFQALADPTRLRILALLRVMELSVGELAQVLGQSQPRVSRHVKILVQSGLVHRRKEGNWVFLTLGEDYLVSPVFAAMQQWDAGPDGAGQGQPDAEALADIARLEAVKAVRAAAADVYFETHAAEWDAIRALHVADDAVEKAIRQILGSEPCGTLVDIGTGTGHMIRVLGAQAGTVIGYDRSPAMLRVARIRLAEAGLPGVDLRQGDMYSLPLPAESADLAVMNQVLHYAQQPASAIAEAGRILAKGGRLLVVDFAPHDRDDLRERDAHVWLGFSDQQIKKWFQAAGLSCVEVMQLKGRLTVRLWLGCRV